MKTTSTHRSLPAGLLLLAGLILSLAMAGGVRLQNNFAVDSPETGTAQEWLRQAESLQAEGRTAAAIEACVAGLVVDPWNPELCRRLTLLRLEESDPEALRLWMDDLVMGDARQAEQLFTLPEFAVHMEDSALRRIHREARMQARD